MSESAIELQQLIENYRTPERARQIVDECEIVLLAGISGAGKDTIKRQLVAGGGFSDLVSHTTRPPRVNNGQPEVDGREYHFINDNQATQMLKGGEFVEAKFVHGTVYGTSIKALKDIARQYKVAVTDIDVQGVAEYKEISNRVIAMFILPPDYDIWRQRFAQRYPDKATFEEAFEVRVQTAVHELTKALEVDYYHFIVNQDLDKAVSAVRDITARHDRFIDKDVEVRQIAQTLLDDIVRRSSI